MVCPLLNNFKKWNERNHKKHVLYGIWYLFIYICLLLNRGVLILYPMFRILQIGLAFIFCQKRSQFSTINSKGIFSQVLCKHWSAASGYSQEFICLSFRTNLKSSSVCCFLVPNINETKSDREMDSLICFLWLIDDILFSCNGVSHLLWWPAAIDIDSGWPSLGNSIDVATYGAELSKLPCRIAWDSWDD